MSTKGRAQSSTCLLYTSECDVLNKVFFHYITTKLPFVSMKYAMTMDGTIATSVSYTHLIDAEGRNLFEENKVIFNERKEKAI